MRNDPDPRSLAEMSSHATAHALGVSPSQLRQWVERFGYPETRIVNGRRSYDRHQVELLLQALPISASPSAAAWMARMWSAEERLESLATDPAIHSADDRTRV